MQSWLGRLLAPMLALSPLALSAQNDVRTYLFSAGNNEFAQRGLGRDPWGPRNVLLPGPAIDADWTNFGGIALLGAGVVFTWGEPGLFGGVPRLTPELVLGLADVEQVSATAEEFIALDALGRVFVWGSQRGPTPTQMPTPEPIAQISGGDEFGLARGFSGRLYAWGKNDDGQLGDGTQTERLSPVRVPELEDIIDVSAGGRHALALRAGGIVLAWGANEFGQVQGSGGPVLVPQAVTGLEPVRDVEAGANHSLALQGNNRLFGWGQGVHGQIANGATNRSTPSEIKTGGIIAEVAAGTLSTMVRHSDNQVVGFGNNTVLVLGSNLAQVIANPTALFNPSIRKLRYGRFNGGWMLVNGQLQSFGPNLAGALGDGRNEFDLNLVRSAPINPSPLAVDNGLRNGYVLQRNRTLLGVGDDSRSELGAGAERIRHFTFQPVSSNVASFAAAQSHVALIRQGGQVATFGQNASGQLGTGDTADRGTPFDVPGLTSTQVDVGFNYTLALQADGTVRAFGANAAGQLGDGTNNNSSSPVTVTGLAGVAQVAAGRLTAYARLLDGRVFAWGSNEANMLGETGSSRNAPAAVPGLSSIVEIDAGALATIARRSDGAVFAWGNVSSLLNNAIEQMPGITHAASVHASFSTAYVRRTDGTVYAMGRGRGGYLGTFTGALIPPVLIPKVNGIVSIEGGTQDQFIYAAKEQVMLAEVGGNRVIGYFTTLNGAITNFVQLGRLAAGLEVVGVGDFSKDTSEDLLLLRTSDRRLFVNAVRGNRNVGFLTSGFVGADFDVVATGDVNADGQADVVLRRRSDGFLTSFLMDGHNIVGGRQLGTPPTGQSFVGMVDLDGDTRADIATVDANRRLRFILTPQSGFGSTVVQGPVLPAGHTVRGFGDFNADFEPDVLIQRDSDRRMFVRFMVGGADIGGATTGNVGSNFRVVGPSRIVVQ